MFGRSRRGHPIMQKTQPMRRELIKTTSIKELSCSTNIIFLSGDDAKEISNTLSIELDKLNSWFAVNKLSLNVSKTNYMIFGNKKIDKDMNIRVGINGISIDRVYNTNFLGVTIDDKLNWKEHIKMIQSKL